MYYYKPPASTIKSVIFSYQLCERVLRKTNSPIERQRLFEHIRVLKVLSFRLKDMRNQGTLPFAHHQ